MSDDEKSDQCTVCGEFISADGSCVCTPAEVAPAEKPNPADFDPEKALEELDDLKRGLAAVVMGSPEIMALPRFLELERDGEARARGAVRAVQMRGWRYTAPDYDAEGLAEKFDQIEAMGGAIFKTEATPSTVRVWVEFERLVETVHYKKPPLETPVDPELGQD